MNREQSSFISALHSKYAQSMVQLTYRRTGDAELSKDLVQETFLIACCKSSVICNHRNPAGWLFCTLQNLTMREMKKFCHSEVALTGDFPAEAENQWFSADFYLPKGLSEAEREIILMRVDRGLSFEEISNIKGISEVACRKQLSRALKNCRELLEEKISIK